MDNSWGKWGGRSITPTAGKHAEVIGLVQLAAIAYEPLVPRVRAVDAMPALSGHGRVRSYPVAGAPLHYGDQGQQGEVGI